MAGKKSALTAALAGGAPAPAPVPKPPTCSLPLESFPCLASAPEPEGDTGDAAAAAALAGGIDSLDIRKTFVPVGSMPTSTLMDGRQLGGCGGIVVVHWAWRKAKRPHRSTASVGGCLQFAP
jgi:hypothetical protein